MRQTEPYPRKIHFDNEIWSYRITGSIIAIRNPDCSKTYKINQFVFSGYGSIYSFEKDNRKKSYHVVPSEIKKYIETNLK